MGHPSLGKGSATAINIIAILTLCLLVLYKIVLSTEKNVVKEIIRIFKFRLIEK